MKSTLHPDYEISVVIQRLEPMIVVLRPWIRMSVRFKTIGVDGELSVGSTVTLTPSFTAGYSGDGIVDTNDVARVEYRIGTESSLSLKSHHLMYPLN